MAVSYHFSKIPKIAELDKKTFIAWEEKRITTKKAIEELDERNYGGLLSEKDFIELANSLGYFRK